MCDYLIFMRIYLHQRPALSQGAFEYGLFHTFTIIAELKVPFEDKFHKFIFSKGKAPSKGEKEKV